MGLSHSLNDRCCSLNLFSRAERTNVHEEDTTGLKSARKLVDSQPAIAAAKMSEQASRGDANGQVAKIYQIEQQRRATLLSTTIPNVTATRTLPRVKQFGKLAVCSLCLPTFLIVNARDRERDFSSS